MKQLPRGFCLLAIFMLSVPGMGFAANPGAGTLTVVGLYSETDAGYVSYRTAGKADWIVVKLGDIIPATAEIKVSVERDWIEVRPSEKIDAVYEIAGNASGEVIKKVPDILKAKPRPVTIPSGTAAKPDAKYKDKLVVTQYLGRQIYMTSDGDSKNIKYGDVLDLKGKVKIIAINNTITLMNASGGVTTVVGPLNFTVEQVLGNKSLYKFLNVQK